MKKFFLCFLIGLVLLACKEERVDGSVPCTEGVEATVRNLTGLDGCGFVFELEDGTKLEPQRILDCTRPVTRGETEDPLCDFNFVDGKKVIIGYEILTTQESFCMAGTVVKITCLNE